ncbi:MAG: hypothetical protein DRJ38_00150 [Thermoprotei archaeon]|nr:MAG: hypothetical protein DRJ38_00150 [Thermoprotei archaeon]
MNKRRYVWIRAGGVPDTRLHVLMVAPPGASKSFWLEQFIQGDHAILRDSGIEVGYIQQTTAAGFVGTTRFVNGGRVYEPGLAEIYKNAILGVEEFSDLTNAFQTEHGRQLENALLTALDSGRVEKSLASGEIRYVTHVTLQCGVQPARYDMSGGLGRRFLFIVFIPSERDFETLKWARRAATGKRLNPLRVDRIRMGIRDIIRKLDKVQDVEIDERLYRFFDRKTDQFRILHFEEELWERLAIGYTVMRGRVDRVLRVTVDDELLRIIERAVADRRKVQRGAAYLQVFVALKDLGGEATPRELRDRLTWYSLDWSQSSPLIADLMRMGALEHSGNKVKLAWSW